MGKYYSVTVSPEETGASNNDLQYSANTLLFDWVPFEIPKGTAMLNMVSYALKGPNGVAADQRDINLYFAKSIDGVAPTSLGTPRSAVTAASAVACRRNMIAFKELDGSEIEENQTSTSVTPLVSYRMH